MEEVEIVEIDVMEVEEKSNEDAFEVVDLENGDLMVDDEDSSGVRDQPVTDVWGLQAYRKAIESAKNRNSKLKERGFGDRLAQRWRALVRGFRSFFKPDEEKESVEYQDVVTEPFLPVMREEEEAVKRAFSPNIQDVLVTHKNSNIDIAGEDLRCLRPGAWLNDEKGKLENQRSF